MRWFVRSDLDGFFGLALDNLVQLLLIDALCTGVLGFDANLVLGRILPGTALAVLAGNLFYSHQAVDLARRTGRTDVCALPYGINTPSVFGFVFLVMLPAKLVAVAGGVAQPERVAFQAGLVASLGSGVIELCSSVVAERLRRAMPRAALLSTLSGVALGFISLGFLFRAFARPIVGLTTFAVVMVTYFGRMRFRGGLPAGFVSVALGTLLAWITGIAPSGPRPPPLHLTLPVPVFGDLWAGLAGGHALAYASVIVPMGLFNVVGSLQNVESAEAAGDSYPAGPSLAANGIGTMLGAVFGSCFPTTIYIGHPGWKALGARTGYSVYNGAFITLVCLTGAVAHIAWAVPIDSGMAIVLWIGIVMTAQAFTATPREHAPAVVIGILPGLAAWGVMLAKTGVRAAAQGSAGPGFDTSLVARFARADTWIGGGFALEQGFIISSMLLAAATVSVIDRQFTRAGVVCFIGSAMSALGLIHSYAFGPTDTRMSLVPSWPFVISYAAMGLIFLLTPWVTVPADEGH